MALTRRTYATENFKSTGALTLSKHEINEQKLCNKLRNNDLILIEGPPRTRKSSYGMKHLLKKAKEEDVVLFVVSRTVDNCLESIKSFKKHIDPGNGDPAIPKGEVDIMTYFGTTNTCVKASKVIEKEDGDKEVVNDARIHAQNCPEGTEYEANTIAKSFLMNDKIEWYRPPTSDVKGVCPRKVQRRLLYLYLENDEPAVVFTTYKPLQIMHEEFGESLYDDNYFLLDEARYILDLPIIGTEKLGGTEYIERKRKDNTEYRKIGKSNLEYHDIFEEWEEYSGSRELQTYLHQFYRKLESLMSLQKPKWNNTKTKLLSDTNPLENKNSSIDLEEPPAQLKKEAENLDFPSVYYRLLLADKCCRDDVRIAFDFLPRGSTKGLSMNIVKAEDGRESREIIRSIREEAQKMLLVDSTFYTEDFYSAVFGEDIELEKVCFEPDYDLNIAVDPTNTSVKRICQNKGDRKRMVAHIENIRKELELPASRVPVFARNTREARALEEEGVDNVRYAYSSDTEGVSIKAEHIIVTGLPRPHSGGDSFRKRDFKFLPEFYGDEEAPQGEEYDDIQAYMQLYQMAFRGGEEQEGVFILNDVSSGERYWDWLNSFKTLKLKEFQQYDSKTKAEAMVEAVRTGDKPDFTRTEKRIANEIGRTLQKNGSMKKTELLEKAESHYKDAKAVLTKLEKKDWVEQVEREDDHHRTRRCRLVGQPPFF